MKFIVTKIAKMFLLSVYMLTVTATWVYGNTAAYTESNFSFADKEENNEKNITGVKVMYNPIAEQINVNFKLSKESTVVIKLMDALGNEVLNLTNSVYEEGTQSLSFETEGKVAAGFYFVKLTSGTETVIKRVSVR